MNLPVELEGMVVEAVTKAIKARFNLDGLTGIEVMSIEVDEEAQKIMIALTVTTAERPEALAKSFFGLTSKVREALGAEWSGFFPVITPNFGPELNA